MMGYGSNAWILVAIALGALIWDSFKVVCQ